MLYTLLLCTSLDGDDGRAWAAGLDLVSLGGRSVDVEIGGAEQ